MHDDGTVRIFNADCRAVLPTLDPVDAVVCDPPYGLKFMGQGWDHGVPGVEFWKHVSAAMKPGAHLLAFGGTRTFHRLTCAIEDAGFEIRDCIMWVYGSGFPKSLDVGKAIDKAAGVERKVTGTRVYGDGHVQRSSVSIGFGGCDPAVDGRDETAPETDAAMKWNGWGTALKPAVEYIVCARKPLDLKGLSVILAQKIGVGICQLRSDARDAEKHSASSPSGSGAAVDSAQWRAVPKFSSPDDLFGAMDTLRSGSEIPTSLNIALSWLDILGALWTHASTFTTETESSLITDLKILNCLSSKNIADAIIEAATGRRGTGLNASLVESIFSVADAKLKCILDSSAQDHATSLGVAGGLRPDWRPIIVARKPLIGTVAENVLKHGTGGINVDGCRVGTDARFSSPAKAGPGTFNCSPGSGTEYNGKIVEGRFPANLIHDGSAEVEAGFPVTGASRAGARGGQGFHNCLGRADRPRHDGNSAAGHTDSGGSASRFFYCAKASRRERLAHLICNCERIEFCVWVKRDRNRNGQTDSTSRDRDTCEGTLAGGWSSSTLPSGKNGTDPSRQDTACTTSTEASGTTGSRTCGSLPIPSISESTADVNAATANGSSPVRFAGECFDSMPGTSICQGPDIRFMGVVVHATSPLSSGVNRCEGCDSDIKRTGHPTQKPESLMRYLCRLVTPPGGVVLDPFMGSGSTLVAARDEGFRAIGIDTEANYCEIASRRVTGSVEAQSALPLASTARNEANQGAA